MYTISYRSGDYCNDASLHYSTTLSTSRGQAKVRHNNNIIGIQLYSSVAVESWSVNVVLRQLSDCHIINYYFQYMYIDTVGRPTLVLIYM